MASDITYSSDGVGVVAKAQWEDASKLRSIRASLNGLSESSVAFDLPLWDQGGARSLRSAVEYFDSTMKMVIDEYADAAENLGSTAQSTGANLSATEHHNQASATRAGEGLK